MEVDVKARLEQMMSQVRRMATDVRTAHQKAYRVTATVKSADGLVTATVGPRGHLVELELDPQIYRRPNSAQLAQTIVQTVREAVEQALNEYQDTVEAIVPEDMRIDNFSEAWGIPKGAQRKHDAEILKVREDDDDE